MNYELAQHMTDDLMSEIEPDLTPSMAQAMRDASMSAFLTTMQGMDANRASSSPEPSDAAADAYHRAMNRDQEEGHMVGQAKAPEQDAGSDTFNLSYDNAGVMTGGTGNGYVFEVQRDGAGRIKRVVAKEQ